MDLLSELIKAGLRYLSTEEGARLITRTIEQSFIPTGMPQVRLRGLEERVKKLESKRVSK